MVAAQAAEVPAVTSQASMAFQAATAQAAARAAEQVAAASTAQAALAASGAAQIGSGGGSGGGGTTEAHATLLGMGFLCPPPAPCARSSNTPAIILGDFKGKDCWCY